MYISMLLFNKLITVEFFSTLTCACIYVYLLAYTKETILVLQGEN